MKRILENHMAAAQFIFDAACTTITLGGCVAIVFLVKAPWPVMQ